MKAVFIHSTRFINAGGKIYEYNLNKEIWKRYRAFDSLEIIGREIVKDKAVGVLASSPKVSFSLKNYKKKSLALLNSKEAFSHIESVVRAADAVIVRLPSTVGLIGIKVAKKLSKPCLVEVVGCAFDAYFNHSLKGKILSPIMFWLTKKAIKKSEYVLYVTESFLQKRYPTAGSQAAISDVLLPPLDENKLVERLKENPIAKEKVTIGTLGSVSARYKGHLYMLKALSRLKKKGITNIYYSIAGGGDNSFLVKKAEKLSISENVIFTGALSKSKVYEWLRSLDGYIQPSLSEGLPRALIEAMATPLYCLGFDTGGISELLEKDAVIPRKSIDGIVEKLLTFEGYEQNLRHNFIRAKDFSEDTLDEKRNAFFEQFVSAIKTSSSSSSQTEDISE